MTISVMFQGDTIFYGDAEDFLEQNSYDEDIEEALNILDAMAVNSEINISGNFDDVYTVIKEEDEEGF